MSSPSISEQVNADLRWWLVQMGLAVFLGAMIVWTLWTAADVRDARDAERARLEERVSALERTLGALTNGGYSAGAEGEFRGAFEPSYAGIVRSDGLSARPSTILDSHPERYRAWSCGLRTREPRR